MTKFFKYTTMLTRRRLKKANVKDFIYKKIYYDVDKTLFKNVNKIIILDFKLDQSDLELIKTLDKGHSVIRKMIYWNNYDIFA